MIDRYEVRLSGSGGQGLILAGKILAEAAAIFDGHNAVQTQSYGPEARGGASKAEVVISDRKMRLQLNRLAGIFFGLLAEVGLAGALVYEPHHARQEAFAPVGPGFALVFPLPAGGVHGIEIRIPFHKVAELMRGEFQRLVEAAF